MSAIRWGGVLVVLGLWLTMILMGCAAHLPPAVLFPAEEEIFESCMCVATIPPSCICRPRNTTVIELEQAPPR